MTVDLIVNMGFDNVLIVCPLRVIPIWPQQFAEHAGRPVHVAALDDRFRNIRARRQEAERQLGVAQTRGLPLVVVTNFDAVWRPPLGDWILARRWDLVVADEAHKLKQPGGKTSLFFARLRDRARYRLALSGTPLPHTVLDGYGLYRFLNPEIFGTSYLQFKKRYAIEGGFQGKQVVGYQRLEEFQEKFSSIAYRADKSVLDLPPAMHTTFTCELSPAARRVYEALERDLIAEVREKQISASNALVKLLRLQQIAGGWLRTDDGGQVRIDRAKQQLLADVLEDIDPAEGVAVFCRFRADLDVVHAVASGLGRRSLELSGRVNQLEAWQSGEAPILAAQIASGGTGVSLVRARYCVYYSLGFSLGEYEQSLARLHRPGQRHPVEYLHLLARNTVDERVMQALAKRADVVNTILAEIEREPKIHGHQWARLRSG